MSIEILQEELKKRAERIAEFKRLEVEANANQAKIDAAFRKKYNAEAEERKELSSRIVDWKNKFIKTPEYRTLKMQIGRDGWDHHVKIFELSEDDGTVGSVYLMPDKTPKPAKFDPKWITKVHLEYIENWRHIGGLHRIEEKEFDSRLDVEFLRKLLHHLATGAVFDTIIKNTDMWIRS